MQSRAMSKEKYNKKCTDWVCYPIRGGITANSEGGDEREWSEAGEGERAVNAVQV